MKVAVLGSGGVGRTLAGATAALGHEVTIGTRDPDELMARTDVPQGTTEPFAAWSAANPSIAVATFAGAAGAAELVINATSGTASLDALRAAGAGNLAGKILIDVANPLDFSAGFPPTLSVSNTDSLGEMIQREFPDAKVVKTLNTVTAAVMIAPGSVGGGDHHIFVSGNDATAKSEVSSLLRDGFGWQAVIDLGDITTARGTEMYLAVWVRLMGTLGTPMFNVKIVT